MKTIAKNTIVFLLLCFAFQSGEAQYVISGPSSTDVGDTETFTVSNAGSLLGRNWSSSGNTVASGQGTISAGIRFNNVGNAIVNFSAVTPGTFNSVFISKNVTVNGTVVGPVSITSGPTSRCQGGGTSDYNASASNATSYSWSLSNAGSSTINSLTGVVTWSSSFSGTARVNVTANGPNNSSSSAFRNVTVTAAASLPPMTTTDTDLCSGSTATLTIPFGASGTTYELLRNNVSIQTVTGANTAINWTVSTAGSYRARATKGGCPPVLGNTITINVSQDLGSPQITGTDELCQGTATTDYSITGGTSQNSYVWSVSGNGNTINSSGLVTWGATFQGSASVSVQATSACGTTTTVSYSVLVIGPPAFSPLVPDDNTLCSGQQTTLRSSFGSGGVVYELYRNNVGTGQTVNGSNGQMTWTINSTGDYKLVANDPTNSCGSFEGATVGVSVQPPIGTVSTISGPDNLCQSDLTTNDYSGSANNADSYSWQLSPTGAGTINASGQVAWNTSFSGDAIVTLTAFDVCGASRNRTLTVTVVPEQTFYEDRDKDGYYVSTVVACANPDSLLYVVQADIIGANDCNDDNPEVSILKTWYLDADGDGRAASSVQSCGSPGIDYTDAPVPVDDCDDTVFDPENDCDEEVSANDFANNYVYSRTYQKTAQDMLAEEGIDQTNGFAFFTPTEAVIQELSYFDGLGRPMQQIGLEQSPLIGGQKKDMVTFIEYDGFGRMVQEWLPHPAVTGTFGGLKTDPKQATLDYYNVPKYENTANPYAEKEFEASPMNRVLRQAAPGNDWAMGQGHEIELAYASNVEDEVRSFRVSFTANDSERPSLIENGHYAPGELYKSITYDENHSGTNKDHSREEFMDKKKRTILKRTYDNEVAHDTYYVYDDYGNLSYVLPPKMEAGTATLANLSGLLEALGYQYVYDYRNRLVEKQLPGKQAEYIVYDYLDRPIMTQDANQRNKDAGSDEWLFTKYDAFGRVAYTGKATAAEGTTREAIQNEVTGLSSDYWVVQGSERNYGGADISYDNGAYPTGSTVAAQLSEVLTINYYDNYNFDRAGTGTSHMAFGIGTTTRVTGLATGAKVKVLDTDDWITSVSFYDEKARPIYTYSKNDYLNTTDIVASKLDFVGRPLQVRAAHTRGNVNIVTLDNFSYDHTGRLLAQTQCIGDDTLGESCEGVVDGGGGGTENDLVLDDILVDSDQLAIGSITLRSTSGQSATLRTTGAGVGVNLRVDPNAAPGGPATSAEERIVSNTYDAIGQLESKEVGGAPTANGLQTVDYEYNVRGWLTDINDISDTNPDKLFTFRLAYNEGPNALYNGNIASTQWRTDNMDKSLKTYQYTYDALNRITGATDNTGNFTLSNVSYDKNGNIETLDRQGHLVENPVLGTSGHFGVMDQMTYDYTGNQLKAVDDAPAASANQGFVDGAELATEYTYDANGNMTADANKGITSITYNYLNLPVQVAITNAEHTGSISYVYDATGAKQQKSVSTGTSTDYNGNYVYENGDIQFFNHPEGYISVENGSYGYVYQYKDHLGSVRLSYIDADGNGSIDPLDEVVEENNYYPFGLKIKGFNDLISSYGNSVAMRWKFSSKEFDETLDIDTYDFGARNYNPTLGRWMNIDPLAQQYYDISTYTYVSNSPLIFIDPDGQQIIFGFQKDKEGNRIGEQGLKNNINSGLGGGDFAQIDKNGNLTINITKKQRGSLTKEQSAFLGVLEEGINAKDSDGNNIDINIGVVSGADDIVIGSFTAEKIDIQDINALGDGAALNQNSALGHEVKEQFERQANGEKRPEAHKAGENAEKAITGFERGEQTNTNRSIKKIVRRERVGTRTYYTRSYDASIRFTNGSKVINETFSVRNGNVVPRKR